MDDQDRFARRLDPRHTAALAELRSVCGVQQSSPTRLDAAIHIVADALDVPLAKVLELEDSKKALRVRAGIGWREGVAGHATVPATNNSSAGYVLGQVGAVTFDDIQRTRRFTDATLLLSHSITSSLAVRITRGGSVIGVLSVHVQEPRQFTSSEATFVEEAAKAVAELL